MDLTPRRCIFCKKAIPDFTDLEQVVKKGLVFWFKNFQKGRKECFSTTERVFNFNPGPATLPESILKKAQEEILNYQGNGMSVIEISHRSKQFEEIIKGSEVLIKELLEVPDNYRVLFIGMGATGQFDMVPMNYIVDGKIGNCVVTGSFAHKAYKEGVKIGPCHVAASTKEINFTRVSRLDEIQMSQNPAFLHITTILPRHLPFI